MKYLILFILSFFLSCKSVEGANVLFGKNTNNDFHFPKDKKIIVVPIYAPGGPYNSNYSQGTVARLTLPYNNSIIIK